LLPPAQQAPIKSSGELQIKYKSFKCQIFKLQITINIPNKKKKTYTRVTVNPIMSIITDIPEWFLQTIESIVSTASPTPNSSSLRFELTPEAATHNRILLQRHNNSIQNYILHNTGTFMSFGSKFHHPDLLEPLPMHHPNWIRFCDLLTKGSNWALYPPYQQLLTRVNCTK
jgi:hypothetical protein